MYKEACSMLKRAGFWNDFKNYADLNDWVRPTLYGLGGAAAGGGIGAGVGALMGPENRGAKIGISAGAGAGIGALLGAGGGLYHNYSNKKQRALELLAKTLKEQHLQLKRRAYQRQLDTWLAEGAQYDAEAAEQQAALDAWHKEQELQAQWLAEGAQYDAEAAEQQAALDAWHKEQEQQAIQRIIDNASRAAGVKFRNMDLAKAFISNPTSFRNSNQANNLDALWTALRNMQLGR